MDERNEHSTPQPVNDQQQPVSPTDSPARSATDKMSVTIENLATRVAEQAELARMQVEKNTVDHGLLRLQRAVEQLQTLARVSTDTALASPGAPGAAARPCGCGEKPPTCCIQLYISGVRVLSGQGLFEGDLELIFAVWALDQCGLLPSLNTHLTISPKGQAWVPTFSPIGKFCVPCNGTLVIPLVGEAMETGALLEGKPEHGSTQSQIALRCNCDIVPVVLTIALGGTGGSKAGKVEVEVSGRLSEGCCC